MTPDLFDALAGTDGVEMALDMIPYGRFLRASLRRDGERLLLRLHFDPIHIGSPGRLHGGIVGAALEFAAMAELMWQARSEGAVSRLLPRPITLTVDYLRAADCRDLMATATVNRQGRRIASVRSLAWQDDESRPVAEGLLHFLVAGRDAAAPGPSRA